jgi:hypothetical protein
MDSARAPSPSPSSRFCFCFCFLPDRVPRRVVRCQSSMPVVSRVASSALALEWYPGVGKRGTTRALTGRSAPRKQLAVARETD